MVKYFGTTDRMKVKFGRLEGDSAPPRRTPGRTEILKRGPSNHRFQTADYRKVKSDELVGRLLPFPGTARTAGGLSLPR
jgi:hypothetical protein